VNASIAKLRTLDESAAAIQAAVANTTAVMPPIAARWMAAGLSRAASIDAVRAMSWQCLEQWLELADEINTYAARATEFVETEAFWGGVDPASATHSVPAQTVDEALRWGTEWGSGIGVAHRTSIRLNGPWQIDQPAASNRKETAA
jgi:hypothetical protein